MRRSRQGDSLDLAECFEESSIGPLLLFTFQVTKCFGGWQRRRVRGLDEWAAAAMSPGHGTPGSLRGSRLGAAATRIGATRQPTVATIAAPCRLACWPGSLNWGCHRHNRPELQWVILSLPCPMSHSPGSGQPSRPSQPVDRPVPLLGRTLLGVNNARVDSAQRSPHLFRTRCAPAPHCASSAPRRNSALCAARHVRPS